MNRPPLRLFNTAANAIQTFEPLERGVVRMYHCGPTVYDAVHIGNIRTFILADLLRRVFEWNSYKVQQVMNITDVDDKTIKRSSDEGKSLSELTRFYEERFLADIAAMNIKKPHQLIRATEHIAAMIALIETLLAKGSAYKAADGVYFRVASFAGYGALVHLKMPTSGGAEGETAGHTLSDEYDKENPRDFALWKFHTEADGEVGWDAPFGRGRPGWHIECSAMAMKTLGETIDIHTGATDLLFPHHTNEIAQSEAATGKPFVRYWVHGAFVLVNDAKMSKSKGTGWTLADVKDEHIAPLSYRYLLLTSHYRTLTNITLDALQAAQTALVKLSMFIAETPGTGTPSQRYIDEFTTFINEDLALPAAVALAWQVVKDKTLSREDKVATLIVFDQVFGLSLASIPRHTVAQQGHEAIHTPHGAAFDTTLPPAIAALVDMREQARAEKDWQKADALRLEIEKRGFVVKDTEKGVVVRPV
jgi:cysteinyl-tRNA synthetase